MRIAVWYNVGSGGAKRALHDHARGLAERGHTLEFFCPETADTAYLPLSRYGPEHQLPCVAPPAGRPWVLGAYRAGPLADRHKLAALDRHCREVAARVDAGGFDVLFGNTCRLTGTAPLAIHARTPSVLYLQEPHRRLYEAHADGHPLAGMPPPGRSRLAPWYVRGWLRDRFEAAILRRQIRDEGTAARAYRRVLVNSYFSRESVLRAYGLDARVCYLGVDAAAFTPSSGGPRGDYVIGVGAFQGNKNVEFVVRAVGRVPPPRPRLVWVGNADRDPTYRDRLQRLAADLRVDLETRVLVTQAELVGLLGRALALVYAPRLEPFGYAPLEANACGTPVIGAAEGGVRETVRDGVNGLLVPPVPEAMAGAIAKLRDDPGLADRLGRAGRELVETEWAVGAGVDRVEGHLKEVAAGEGG